MDGCYHGLTYGSMSITHTPHFRDGFGPFLPDTDKIGFADLADLEAKLKEGNVAAFISEPVIGHGVDIPPDGFFPKAQELCRKYGAAELAPLDDSAEEAARQVMLTRLHIL